MSDDPTIRTGWDADRRDMGREGVCLQPQSCSDCAKFVWQIADDGSIEAFLNGPKKGPA